MDGAPEKIEDIARKLGLSRPTVSYILNDKWESRGISAATAGRVLAYVKETGFKANIIGLALRGKACKEIAILIPVSPTEHQKQAFFSLLRFLEDSRKSYFVLPVSEESLSETVQFLRMYKVRKIIGISLSPCYGSKGWAFFSRELKGMDYLLYDFPFETLNANDFLLPGGNLLVGFDRNAAKALALKHIVDCGYRHLILPGGFPFPCLEGLSREYGLKVECYDTRFGGLSLFEMGEAAAKQVMAFVEPGVPKALYVNDDKMSFAAIKYLCDHGVDVPRQIAVESWDGLPESAYFSIPLTTLVVPHAKMIACAVDWLGGRRFKDRRVVLEAEVRKGKSLPPL